MSRHVRFTAAIAAAAVLWGWASSLEIGIASIAFHALVGATTGIVIGVISRAFASTRLTLRSVLASALGGALILAPVLAMLMTGSEKNTGVYVILLLSAAALAAIGGAVWGVLDRITEAYGEWRHTQRRRFTPGGAHR
jgi:hypothetical protein